MTRGWALVGALFVLVGALSCSWLVDPPVDMLPCAQVAGAPNVCPDDLQCIEGHCAVACKPELELCSDQRDNDCDGQIDEIDALGRDTCGDGLDNDCDGKMDEGSDVDQDGFPWCGNTRSTDGGQGRDCDDMFSSSHPGAVEMCDGRDNDCDALTDEAAAGTSLCPPGLLCVNQRCVVPSCLNEGPGFACAANERCVPETGKCVSKQCADVTCASQEFCDEATKTCKPKEKRDNGAPCGADADCKSNSCIDAAALRLASGARVCGQSCCSDQHCGAGQRCFASGTGARSCLPIAQAPVTTSRECSAESNCQDTEVCSLSRDHTLSPPTFLARAQVITSTCQVAAAGTDESGERCAGYRDCASRACVSSFPFGFLCSNPCGSSNDCMALGLAAPGGLGAYCRYVDVTLDGSPVDYAPICVVRRPGETGPGVYGAECSSSSDCLDAGCVGATSTKKGRCTSTCCHDSQCGPREDSQPIRCRPFAFGSRYEMRCDI